jgi:ATP-dependent RNA helicase
MKTFRDLGIREDILEAIEKKGYQNPSPIQERVIPVFLTGDKDII